MVRMLESGLTNINKKKYNFRYIFNFFLNIIYYRIDKNKAND